MEYRRNSYCSYCGHRFPEPIVSDASCGACKEKTWVNPIPVSVLLLPIIDADGRIGILLTRRGIPPFEDEWCLPGGHLEISDGSFETAAARECREETGVTLPKGWPISLVSSRVGTWDGLCRVIVDSRADPIPFSLVPHPFTPKPEVLEIKLAYRPSPLCFETHTALLAWYFSRQHAIDTGRSC